MKKLNKNTEKEKKGIITKIFDKLDKKLGEKVKNNSCCGNDNKKGGCSC